MKSTPQNHIARSGIAGPIWVAIAATLWATDGLVRWAAIDSLDPTYVVLLEHVIAVVAMIPWAIASGRQKMLALRPREWAAIVFTGVLSSALATTLFTASFKYVNPSVTVLIQKLQPLFVVGLAYLFLGEKPGPKFKFWAPLALISATWLSFPDFGWSTLSGLFGPSATNTVSSSATSPLNESGALLAANHRTGVLYAFLSAGIWALGTITGKIALNRISPALATFWRFTFGSLALYWAFAWAGPTSFEQQLNLSSVGALPLQLAYLGLMPGLFAMLAYYRGLQATLANITTFVELVFPVGAILLNTIFLHAPLTPTQWISGSLLVFSVTMISLK